MACLKGSQQHDNLLCRLLQARRPASREEQPGRRSLETVAGPSSQYRCSFCPTQPLMEKRICVDLQKRTDGHTASSFAHGDRRNETLALGASAEDLKVNIVDFLRRWSCIVESGPPPVPKQAVKDNMHGRESDNVELRPSCRSHRLPMSKRQVTRLT